MNKKIIFLLSIATLIISCNEKGDSHKLNGTWQNHESANGLASGVISRWVFSDSSKGAYQKEINEETLTVNSTNPIEWSVQQIGDKKCIVVKYGKAQVESSDDYMKQILEDDDLMYNTSDTLQYSFQDDNTLVLNHLTIKQTVKDTAKHNFIRQ